MLVLLFDGHCGICTRLVRVVSRHDRLGRIAAEPSQRPGLIERYGLTREQVDREVWAFDAAGNAYAGASAVFRVLAELGGAWPFVAWLFRLPPFKRLADGAYRLFARHRALFGRWGVTPACDEPAAGCA